MSRWNVLFEEKDRQYLSMLGLLIAAALVLTGCSPRTLVVGLDPATLQKQESAVMSVAFSPDGKLLATGAGDGTIRVWSAGQSPSDFAHLMTWRISTGDEEASHSHDVAFSPDSKTLAFGLPDGSVRLWRLSLDRSGDDGQENLEAASLDPLRAEESKICSLGFAPGGRTLAAGSGDGSVHLWRVADGTHVRSMRAHSNGVVSVAFSPDGTTLASAGLDGAARLWDVASATMIHEHEGSPAVTGVAFSPDGSLIAMTTSTGERQLLDAADLGPLRELASAGGGMGNIVFSPDGTTMAAGNGRHEVSWWNVDDGTLLGAERAHRDSVNSVAFSPDGGLLASGSLDGTVKLWGVPAVR